MCDSNKHADMCKKFCAVKAANEHSAADKRKRACEASEKLKDQCEVLQQSVALVQENLASVKAQLGELAGACQPEPELEPCCPTDARN